MRLVRLIYMILLYRWQLLPNLNLNLDLKGPLKMTFAFDSFVLSLSQILVWILHHHTEIPNEQMNISIFTRSLCFMYLHEECQKKIILPVNMAASKVMMPNNHLEDYQPKHQKWKRKPLVNQIWLEIYI